MMDIQHDDRASGFRIYRASEAKPLVRAKDRGVYREGYDPEGPAEKGMQRLVEAGLSGGAVSRVMFSSPTMHVTAAWFKSGFPLPLHSHDADCFYQITAGSIFIGEEELRRGDGVFVPAKVLYSFTTGPDGVEFIEFRTTDRYDTEFRAATPAYWQKTAEAIQAHQADWREARRPG